MIFSMFVGKEKRQRKKVEVVVVVVVGSRSSGKRNFCLETGDYLEDEFHRLHSPSHLTN